MQDYLIQQDYKDYTKDQHKTWSFLFKTQQEILKNRAFDLFLDCLEDLDINERAMPNFDKINALLRKKTGWEILPVNGFIPSQDFFGFLAEKKFPSTAFIRDQNHLDYLQEPDIFHDIFGHIPLLANPVFAGYMHEFGKKGVEGLQLGYIDYVTRLYWFTVEFGLIQSPKGLRIYGSGIVSSKGESIYSLESPEPHRLAFDIIRVMRTDFRIDEYQKIYYIIPNLEELFEVIQHDLIPFYKKAQTLGDIKNYSLHKNDTLFINVN